MTCDVLLSWAHVFQRNPLAIYSGPVTLNPRWLPIPATVKYSGLSRSRLYELLSEGRIRSIYVKSQKRAQRGVPSLTGTGTFSLALPSRSCFPARKTFWMQPSGWTFDRECDSVRTNILRHSPNAEGISRQEPGVTTKSSGAPCEALMYYLKGD